MLFRSPTSAFVKSAVYFLARGEVQHQQGADTLCVGNARGPAATIHRPSKSVICTRPFELPKTSYSGTIWHTFEYSRRTEDPLSLLFRARPSRHHRSVTKSRGQTPSRDFPFSHVELCDQHRGRGFNWRAPVCSGPRCGIAIHARRVSASREVPPAFESLCVIGRAHV